MLSLYEILKASKTGIAPDMWTALAGMNWGGKDSGAKVKELTGIPPLSFRADGTPLLDWYIKGNTVQNGTPTPNNPIMPEGTGERTKNLFDGNYTIAVMSVSGHTATLNTASSGRTAIVKCEPNTTYTLKKYSVSNRFLIAESDIKPVNGTAMSIIQNDSSISEYTFTTSNTTQYVAIYCSTSSEQSEPQLMLNTGSTAKPYEPYGYKIPISSAGQTNNTYLCNVQTTRYVKQLVLTGEEKWLYDSNGSRCYINITDAYAKGNRRTQCYCSHYICVYNGEPFNTIPNHSIYINLYNNVARFYINDEEFTSTADFKSFLAAQFAAGTPVTVWYVLAEPETGILNEPLRKIGDYADTVSYEQAGVQIPTNRGNTVIDVETELKPSEVYIKYKG